MNKLVDLARDFAVNAHREIGQIRKYTNEPYEVHLKAVADLVLTAANCTDYMLAAAWLHDVVEDTPVTHAMVYQTFGPVVGSYVEWLTNVTKVSDGKRQFRKRIEALRLSVAPAEVQTIKLADVIDNVPSITKFDKGFAEVYVLEKLFLVAHLLKGDSHLLNVAKLVLGNAQKELKFL